MSLQSTFDPASFEAKWYKAWTEAGLFAAQPTEGKEPYTIVIPPPNVTGVLHMGHMLNNTIQDVLIRRARMQGKAACWVPGTDHAAIATETKVVQKLAAEGKSKKEIGREAFLEACWEWTHEYGGIILQQLKRLGCSLDWDRQAFTMDQARSESVLKVFVRLHEKGLIYRGLRMVNWDPKGKTALSDDEVIYREVDSQLYYVDYPLVGQEGAIQIATTRPETIMADTAVAVNPTDEKLKHLIGQKCRVPIVNREVPIIADEHIDPSFGAGALKVTPAHSLADYEIGQRHGLHSVDILNDDGTLNDKAEHPDLVGMDRFEARKAVPKLLKEQGLLAKQENYRSSVGFSERSDAVVEPRMSTQWFLKMTELSKPALENVMNDTIEFFPKKFKNMYQRWMENVQDWCISRQLWWGHQIPAYYLPDGSFVVAETAEQALAKAQAKDPKLTATDLRQDPDVLDTWFSSWLWPISVFDGVRNPDSADLKYFYPTATLVTAPDIIFFWVARMIIAGYELEGQLPFKSVYFTGIVRDKQRRKMSKSLGNSPDPIELMEQYGADGVRAGMLFSAPAGNDLLFDEKLCEQGRNFANKLWNGFRLVQGWDTTEAPSTPLEQLALDWMQARIGQTAAEVEADFASFRLSDALMRIYKLIWDDYSSWYLEAIKPAYGEGLAAATQQATHGVLEQLLALLHPFMPFITEEVWSQFHEQGDFLCTAAWPEPQPGDKELLTQGELAQEIVNLLRGHRSQAGLSPKESLTCAYTVAPRFEGFIAKLANVQKADSLEQAKPLIGSKVKLEVEAPPLAEEDVAQLQEQLEYQRGFLATVEKKLNNERFVANAPEAVVAAERKKQADAKAKIEALQASLDAMG